jgi:hypothetical protein
MRYTDDRDDDALRPHLPISCTVVLVLAARQLS